MLLGLVDYFVFILSKGEDHFRISRRVYNLCGLRRSTWVVMGFAVDFLRGGGRVTSKIGSK